MLQRADEADAGATIRDDAHHIRAPLDLSLFNRSCGLVFR
jgi:hypothetical protein